MRFLSYVNFGRKERSDGIASQQVRLWQASMTIISYFHKDEISPLRFTTVEMTYSLISYNQYLVTSTET